MTTRKNHACNGINIESERQYEYSDNIRWKLVSKFDEYK